MSWNLQVSGEKDEVIDMVNADAYVPPGVKAVISGQVAAIDLDHNQRYDPKSKWCVLVETHGHFDVLNSHCEIKVRSVRIGLMPTSG